MLDAWIDKSGGASPSLVARPPSLVVRPPSLVARAPAWNRISGSVFGVLDWDRGIGLKSASWIRLSGCFDCFFVASIGIRRLVLTFRVFYWMLGATLRGPGLTFRGMGLTFRSLGLTCWGLGLKFKVLGRLSDAWA